jgi:hypothetical protein
MEDYHKKVSIVIKFVGRSFYYKRHSPTKYRRKEYEAAERNVVILKPGQKYLAIVQTLS